MFDQDFRDVPTVVVLWDKVHRTRVARTCDICKESIAPGERYATTGQRVDGVFEVWIRHEGGERYPSGCPKFAATDRAEAEDQIAKDQSLWDSGAGNAD